MSRKQTRLFYLIWSLAIVLCVLLSVFCVIFASFSHDTPADSSGESAWVCSVDGNTL